MFTARTRLVAACVACLCTANAAFSQPTPSDPLTERTYRFLALPRFPEGIDDNPRGPLSVLGDVEAVIPGHGPLFDRFNGGVSTGIGLGIPIGPVRESPLGGVVSWNAIIDYRYLWLDGRNGVQLNQPGGKDFNINHANFNLCEIGIERKVNFFVFSISDEPIFAGQPGGGIQCSMGVRGQFGGANADVSQSRFDPAKQQIIIQGAPRTQAFVGGYEVYAKLGYQLRNGIDISVYAGYGQLFTSLLQNQSRANGYVPLGVMVSIPLGAMEDTFVRRSIMQPR